MANLAIYEDKTMNNANKVIFDTNAQCCDIRNKIINNKIKLNMKVFAFKRTAGYSGGLAIVVANSKYEAYGILCAEGDFYNELYKIDSCVELNDLTTELKEPKFIIEHGYTE